MDTNDNLKKYLKYKYKYLLLKQEGGMKPSSSGTSIPSLSEPQIIEILRKNNLLQYFENRESFTEILKILQQSVSNNILTLPDSLPDDPDYTIKNADNGRSIYFGINFKVSYDNNGNSIPVASTDFKNKVMQRQEIISTTNNPHMTLFEIRYNKINDGNLKKLKYRNPIPQIYINMNKLLKNYIITYTQFEYEILGVNQDFFVKKFNFMGDKYMELEKDFITEIAKLIGVNPNYVSLTKTKNFNIYKFTNGVEIALKVYRNILDYSNNQSIKPHVTFARNLTGNPERNLAELKGKILKGTFEPFKKSYRLSELGNFDIIGS